MTLRWLPNNPGKRLCVNQMISPANNNTMIREQEEMLKVGVDVFISDSIYILHQGCNSDSAKQSKAKVKICDHFLCLFTIS